MNSTFFCLHKIVYRFLFALLFTSCFPGISFSQSQAPPMKWGKVSDKELKLKFVEYDSTATAVVLSDYGTITFNYGSYITINRHTRIKILDRKAIDRANITLPYYIGNDLEKITDIKAQTINVNAQGKATYHELSDKQVFDIKINENWQEKRFTLPSVSEGSIIEYKYTTLSKNFSFLDAWVFQHDIPTLHSELLASIGQDLDYRLLYQGVRLLQKYSEKTTNRWMLDNLPALIDEPFTANYMDYAEKIRFQLAGYYKSKDGIAGGLEYVTTMTTWEKLAKEILEDQDYTSYLNRRNIGSKVLEKINTSESADRVQQIYDYVKNNIRWNGNYRIYPKKSIAELLETREGSSAEINLLLTLLLSEAGFTANPVLVSTREHGKPQRTYPLRSQFNHVIVYVQAGDKSYVLNATDPLRSYKMLDKEDLNMAGFLLDEEKPRWIEIKPTLETKEVILMTADLSDIKKPTYQADVNFKGYLSLDHKRSFLKLGQDAYIKKQTTAGLTDYTLTSFTPSPIEDAEQDFRTIYQFTSETSNTDAKMLYIKPVLLHSFQENPYKQVDRRLPVEHDYQVGFNYILNMKIPAGYQVQELPKSISVRLPENMGDFRYDIKHSGQQIQLSTSVTVKPFLQTADYYLYLKEFHNQVMAKFNEFIVLQKQ